MKPQPTTVLVADASNERRGALLSALGEGGLSAAGVASGAAALDAVDKAPCEVLVTALALPDMDGVSLLETVVARWPDLPVIIAASDASVPDAVEALKAGAADFVVEPFDREQLAFVVKKALESVRRLADAERGFAPSGAILGNTPTMREVLSLIDRAAPGTASVLVRGESGTGKELVARAIHAKSARAKAPFVKIDCAALPDTLLESELFGYERGAFTGAVAQKPGRVELADHGTLFLDEIGELSQQVQAKLLRLLQDREIERLGSTKTIAVDVRIIAATHRDLEHMIENGQFRQDLFYRLNVVPLWVPPLRARRNDIELLARHFVAVFGAANGRPDVDLTEGASRVLRARRWPGNVRQLQNFVERLVVLSQKRVIDVPDVEAELSRQVRFETESISLAAESATEDPGEHRVGVDDVAPLDDELRAAEKRALERALSAAAGNRSLAARLLAVSRSTLYAKLAEYGLL